MREIARACIAALDRGRDHGAGALLRQALVARCAAMLVFASVTSRARVTSRKAARRSRATRPPVQYPLSRERADAAA